MYCDSIIAYFDMTQTFQSDAALFEEEQRFRQGWLWGLVLGASALILVAPLLLLVRAPRLEPSTVGLLAAALAVLLLVVGLWLARLRVRVTPAELQVRFVPFFVDRHIALPEIMGYTVLRYNPLLAGYGIHFSTYGLVYNVSGREGVQLRLRNGKRVLVGTQRAQEFCAALAQAGARPK